MTNDWTDSWTRVSEQIRQAEASAGRPAHAVRLLAVSKTFPVQAVLELAEATGQRDFGENYVQEGLDKIAATRGHALAQDLVWHCIGPLQSNKTRAVAEHFHWVHSVDRLRIAQRLSRKTSSVEACCVFDHDHQTSPHRFGHRRCLARPTRVRT